MYCACTECNVFVCANVHVRSQGFHYIRRGATVGWLSVCLLLVCCVVFFIFFSIRQITRHAIYSSLLGVVLITC